jgi:arsenate reductase (glutaredoxin)
MTVEIWINLTCTRCSSALFLFEQEGWDYSVRRYLDDPPSADELRDLLHRLGSEPWGSRRSSRGKSDSFPGSVPRVRAASG